MFKLDSTGEIVAPYVDAVGEFVEAPAGSWGTGLWILEFDKADFNPRDSYSYPYLLRFRVPYSIGFISYSKNTRKINRVAGYYPVSTVNTKAGAANSGTNYYMYSNASTKPEPGFVINASGDPGYGSCGFTKG